MSNIYAYGRVSSTEQNESRQLAAFAQLNLAAKRLSARGSFGFWQRETH